MLKQTCAKLESECWSGANPPARITRVFHARLKGPMIPCSVVPALIREPPGWTTNFHLRLLLFSVTPSLIVKTTEF